MSCGLVDSLCPAWPRSLSHSSNCLQPAATPWVEMIYSAATMCGSTRTGPDPLRSRSQTTNRISASRADFYAPGTAAKRGHGAWQQAMSAMPVRHELEAQSRFPCHEHLIMESTHEQDNNTGWWRRPYAAGDSRPRASARYSRHRRTV